MVNTPLVTAIVAVVPSTVSTKPNVLPAANTTLRFNFMLAVEVVNPIWMSVAPVVDSIVFWKNFNCPTCS